MKNFKNIIICILVLIVIGIFLINPIKKTSYSIKFKNSAQKILLEKYDIVDSSYFSGKYNLNVNLNMNSEFSSLEFADQKNIIQSITKDFNTLYISYKNKMTKIDSNINNSYGMIKFYTDTHFYNTNFVSITIHKNGDTTIEYKEKDYLIDQIKLKISTINLISTDQENLYTYLNGIDDIETYKYLLNLDNNNIFLQEIAYQYLLKLSDNNEYSESILNYKEKLSNYKDANTLFQKITELQKNYYSIPRIGMTKHQVLNTTWGQPTLKSEDKPNSYNRHHKDGEESFLYTRGTTRIMINFKDGKVDSFFVTAKGDVMAKEVYSVEGY